MLCRVSLWKGFGGDEISTQFLAQPRTDKYIVFACSVGVFWAGESCVFMFVLL